MKNTFSDWVKQQVEDRNERVKSKKKMMIDMDPDLAEAFAASTKVSVSISCSAKFTNVYFTIAHQRHWCKPVEI